MEVTLFHLYSILIILGHRVRAVRKEEGKRIKTEFFIVQKSVFF